ILIYIGALKFLDFLQRTNFSQMTDVDITAEIKDTDMPEEMRHATVELCKEAVRTREAEGKIASYIKNGMDSAFPGVKWHCLVGKAYSSYFTHDEGSFINVVVGKENIIVFRAS
ncbi:dynein light chain type 1, partial [Gregarina niphandrodes]